MTVLKHSEKKNGQKNQRNSIGPLHRQAMMTMMAEMYSGPIPKGDELLKYEQACPGAADRIIAMAERQAEHRQGLELKVVDANIVGERIGSVFALVITLSLIMSGLYLTLNGKTAEGITSLLSGPAIQAIILFFIQRKAAPEELKRKDQETKR